jgi:hypothetical protein
VGLSSVGLFYPPLVLALGLSVGDASKARRPFRFGPTQYWNIVSNIGFLFSVGLFYPPFGPGARAARWWCLERRRRFHSEPDPILDFFPQYWTVTKTQYWEKMFQYGARIEI